MNRMFNDFEKDFMSNPFSASSYGFKTDIKDDGKNFTVEAELPGFNKEDISIDIDKDVLTVSASHKSENEEKTDKYVRRERSYGSFSRSFDVTGIDAENIKAAYNNGVLELTLPKLEAVEPAKKQIAIE